MLARRLWLKIKIQVIGAVVAAYYVAGSVARQSSQVADAFREYRHLKILKQPIKSNYIITMSQ